MANNRASAELQSLLQISGQAVDAGAHLEQLQQTRQPVATTSPGEEASFALPEALATAVGAGFVLGPVGGILLGAAQGILGKQAKQSVLDQLASERGLISETDSIFNDELDRLSMATDDPDDLAQLNSMQATKDVALKMMASASPRMQEQGAAMLTKFNGDLQAYTERQETQRIAADTLDAQQRRELDNTQYSRYNSAIGSFRSESQTYLDVMEATDTALRALGSGTPADLWAAGILVNKALDPAGIVRQEEAESVGKLGGLWTKANVILEKAKSGETILPEQRRELSALLGTIRDTTTSHQLAREARYSDEVEDIGLPTKYHDNFRLVKTVPASNPPPIVGNTPTPQGVLDQVAEVLPGANKPPNTITPGDLLPKAGWLDSLLDRLPTARKREKNRGVNQ